MRHARLFTVLIFTLIIVLTAVPAFSAATDFESAEAGLGSSLSLNPDTVPGTDEFLVPISEVPTDTVPGTDAVLVIDVSGSMMDSDPDYHCREAALSFVRELADSDSSRAAVITFSDQIVLSSSLMRLDTEHGVQSVSDFLNSVSYTRGDTDIGLALQTAGQLLTGESSPERSGCILLLTDGEIDLPRAADEEAAEKDSLAKALLAAEDCARSEIDIHTVMLDTAGTLDPYLCRYIAEKTGGSATVTADASSLPDLFKTVAASAAARAAEKAALLYPETEAETEQAEETEAVTEPVTETETEQLPAVIVTGSIDGPVILRGLLPGMCRAKLDMSQIFQYAPSEDDMLRQKYPSAYPDFEEEDDSPVLLFSATSSDPSTLSCSVDGDILHLTGSAKGLAEVTLQAKPAEGGDYTDCGPIRFEASVRPVFSSPWMIAAILAVVASVPLIVFLILRFGPGGGCLAGSLQWYIRTEGEKIYGVPSRACADLEAYGRKVSLADLIEDELLEDARLDKVILTPARNGVKICSHTGTILLSAPGTGTCRSLLLESDTDLRILCRTEHGNVSVMAQYLLQDGFEGYEYADASEERTRMLIPDDRTMAG